MTIYIVLPAYNEEENIGELIKAIGVFLKNKYAYQIIVIDDGSTDNTAKITNTQKRHFPIHLVRHKVNHGLGEAVKTGLETATAKAKNDDLIITMDADNTHDLGAIPLMVNKYQQGYELILASRFSEGGRDEGIAWLRKLLSHHAGAIFQIIFPIDGVREYTCSYRAYSPGLLKQAAKTYGNDFIKEQGFNCMLEILVKLSRLHPKIIEVPFTLYYHRKKGKSKMNLKRTLWRYFTIVINRQQFLN